MTDNIQDLWIKFYYLRRQVEFLEKIIVAVFLAALCGAILAIVLRSIC